MTFRHHEIVSIVPTAVNLPLSVGVRDHISLDLLGLQHRAMIKIVLVFIVQIIWGSSSSNDPLAVQTSPQLDGDLLASAEVVSQGTRETRRVKTPRPLSAMLASVALSCEVQEI